ncbi:hypothetical protein [Thermocoleostomius sinensis]|uniref:Uncharacterized protein n=1 Tax=Thermocoleostomius sinensis A174 TaxID=2016057 RepID=A0A9E8Z8I9_9CYAN|nr:hypothetical protein [Thermocoleostomius sinensis]WAL58465.1 hypothetical protein OXH18_14870 [Thermocoleostomius sinensis A174]
MKYSNANGHINSGGGYGTQSNKLLVSPHLTGTMLSIRRKFDR